MKTIKIYQKESGQRFSQLLEKKGINKSNVFEKIEENDKKYKVGTSFKKLIPYSGSIYYALGMMIPRDRINKLFSKLSFK